MGLNKSEIIERYGEEAWERRLEQIRAWREAHKEKVQTYNREYYEDHREEVKAATKKYREEHPEEKKAIDKKYYEEHLEQVIAKSQEHGRKGGKHYDKYLVYNRTGLRGERKKIRAKHQYQYLRYKRIIAPDSQIHHEWIPNTAEYRGVALVEVNPHQYGIIDVIQILDGEITVLTEEEVKNGKKKKDLNTK